MIGYIQARFGVYALQSSMRYMIVVDRVFGLVGLYGVVWVVLLDRVIPNHFLRGFMPTDMLGAKLSVTLGKKLTVRSEGNLLSGPKDFDTPAPAIKLQSFFPLATFNTGASSHWSLLVTAEVELNPIPFSASKQEPIILSVSIAR
ncbi:hypothetical protein JMJ35_005181 [Cladonia borealis]|uniref:Uncharacterized protein n=1 Tax=Cladonia borealis TaxID=184061 RepID=A0AA39V1A4_9LECA|nr:hypothetical protein JMJ35_005181 [Cladonia borealis]